MGYSPARVGQHAPVASLHVVEGKLSKGHDDIRHFGVTVLCDATVRPGAAPSKRDVVEHEAPITADPHVIDPNKLIWQNAAQCMGGLLVPVEGVHRLGLAGLIVLDDNQ
jgi:hypothetical protein